MAIVHTLEAHKPDLSDLPIAKKNRGNPATGMRIGDKAAMGRILVRNEPGNGIVDDVAPMAVRSEQNACKSNKITYLSVSAYRIVSAASVSYTIALLCEIRLVHVFISYPHTQGSKF